MKKLLFNALIFGCSLSIFSCNQEKEIGDNQLTDDEKKAGYELLFDGKTTTGWHLYNQGNKESVWHVQEGELICGAGGDGNHGDLVSDKEFKNYELSFDWKISEAGNSGVFVNVQEKQDNPTAWTSGPEYQLLDEVHPDYAKENKRAGCLYGFSPQLNPVKLAAKGQWNHSVIRQENGKIEFLLNGTLTAQQDFNSPEWKEKIAATNFKNFPSFGMATSGKIALQDWNKGVSFKNIKIKAL